MKMIAMVCCCQRDAEMLPIFVRQWRSIHPMIPLVVGNDKKSPIATNMQQYPIDWKHQSALSIMRAMLSACIDHGAEVVFKLDVDAFHRRSFLPRLFDNPNVMAAGIQWLDNPHNFLGIAYGVRKSLLMAMEVKTTCAMWNSPEDAAMSWMARKYAPNGVHLLIPTTARRAQTDDGTAAVVHCGSYKERSHVLDAMKRFTSFPVCPSVPLRNSQG